MAYEALGTRLVDKTEELEAFLPDEPLSEARQKRPRGVLKTLFLYAAVAAGALSYLFLLLSYVQTWQQKGNGAACASAYPVDEYESVYVDAPLQTHLHTIDSKGLPSYFNTPDDPRVQQDAEEWLHDVSVGMLAITEEELARLPGNKDSAPFHDPQTSREVDGLYVVQTSASHQMACLKIIHDTIWSLAVDGVRDPYDLQHTDHCIGYLRQLVRCRPDLTPIRFQWVAEHHAYMTGTRLEEHVCRSWDAVFAWQQGRNTTGVTVVGKHASLPGTTGHHLKPGENIAKAAWQPI